MKYIKLICMLCCILMPVEGFSQNKITRTHSSGNGSRNKTTVSNRGKTGNNSKVQNKTHSGKVGDKGNQSSSVSQGYVDLGLASGTRWKSSNEEGGLYDWDTAMSKFGDKMPTNEQWEELQGDCTWTWNGSGYEVTGPNGKSIVLPAAGRRNCGGGMYGVGSYGYYWSSTPSGSELAWYLLFDSVGVSMYSGSRCFGLSVRLVQD